MARPNILIANINTVFSNAIGTLDYNDILGLKFIRRTTLKKYLDNGSGSSSNPPTEYPRQVWIMDRIKTRSKSYVQIELLSPFDLETAKIPARVIYADRCSFKYQGASPHLDRWKREQSGCNWHIEGTVYGGSTGNGVKFTVFVNEDDEYIVPSTTSFITVGSTSFSATKDAYYRNTKTSARFNADGGTRCASITAACIALRLAVRRLINEGECLPIGLRPSREDLKNGWKKPNLSEEEKSNHENNVIMNDVAAVSVGLIGDDIYLDLDYILDSNADVDMNVVMTSNREFVEVQGTGEESTYSREQLNSLLDMAEKGNSLLHKMQVKVLSDAN